MEMAESVFEPDMVIGCFGCAPAGTGLNKRSLVVSSQKNLSPPKEAMHPRDAVRSPKGARNSRPSTRAPRIPARTATCLGRCGFDFTPFVFAASKAYRAGQISSPNSTHEIGGLRYHEFLGFDRQR